MTGCPRWRQTLDCCRRDFRTTKLIFLNDANDVQNIICHSGRFSLATEWQNIPTRLVLYDIDNAVRVCHVTVYVYSYCLDVTSVDLDNYVAWLFFYFYLRKIQLFFVDSTCVILRLTLGDCRHSTLFSICKTAGIIWFGCLYQKKRRKNKNWSHTPASGNGQAMKVSATTTRIKG